MITFKIVPMPGVCLSGIQSNRTLPLIMNVENPTLHVVRTTTPCAKTVHGLTPDPAAIRIASPIPNNTRPRTRYPSVIILGKKINGFGELHGKEGMVLIDKKDILSFMFDCIQVIKKETISSIKMIKK
jgi:hypothetical protein